jgi:hypothetical protein
MKRIILALAVIYTGQAFASGPPTKLILITPTGAEAAAVSENGSDVPVAVDRKYQLVEEFTAPTLQQYEFKIGSDFEVGLTDRIMLGTDSWSTVMGIPTGTTKVGIFENGQHQVSLGLRAIWLTLGNLSDFAPAKDYFRYLNAKVFRPSIAWTNNLSPRLKLHTFWAVRVGKVEAELSEKGQQRFWEAKHPGGDYATRTKDAGDSLGDTGAPTADSGTVGAEVPEETPADVKSVKNQEKKSEKLSDISRRTLELQGLFGLSTDRFQITGEYIRNDNTKVLFSSRMERLAMEKLKANSLSLTVAQQWITGTFQFRLGIGVQYLALTGQDLDGEEVDEAGISPVPQVAFYWRF